MNPQGNVGEGEYAVSMNILIFSHREIFPPPIALFNWGRCPKDGGGIDELVKCDEEGALKDVREVIEGK
jgi:hypothetical protein